MIFTSKPWAHDPVKLPTASMVPLSNWIGVMTPNPIAKRYHTCSCHYHLQESLPRDPLDLTLRHPRQFGKAVFNGLADIGMKYENERKKEMKETVTKHWSPGVWHAEEAIMNEYIYILTTAVSHGMCLLSHSCVCQIPVRLGALSAA